MSPHAAACRSLHLLVAACCVLSTLRALSSLRSLARVYWTCVHVFARICTYARLPGRICAYLHVSARICEYLPEFACIFVCLCAFLLVSARICTHSQELLKTMSKCSKKTTQKGSQNDPQNRPKTTPKSTPGGSQDGVWLLRVFGVNFGSFEQLSRGPKTYQKSR